MKVRRRQTRKPIVSVNAMSDIAFLLLIFIMVISLLNYRKEVKIEYPEAREPEVTQGDANLEIWIDRTGLLYVDGRVLSLEDVENSIAEAVSRDPSIRIHLLADRNTPYKYVDAVMEILKLLQHRVVSLVVKESG
jgi:biopolymer transport protein ExbD